MLSMLHPDVLAALDFPAGLYSPALDVDKPVLVVKATKEFLLAAQINKGFKMYVVPIKIDGMVTVSIVSAFFDDEDEPLILQTPLFNEEVCTLLRATLLGNELDVHLFDEHNREMLGYAAHAVVSAATRILLTDAHLFPFDISIAKTMLDTASAWFGRRNANDDAAAIVVEFGAALFPEDIFILDFRPKLHGFHGTRGHSHTTLVRKEPGKFQEHDIVFLLQRIFRPNQIYLGPLKITDQEEIADVVVITDRRVLIVQAKDSPNMAEVIGNKINRKKATAMKSLKKAIRQVEGAVKHIRYQSPLRMLVSGTEVLVQIDTHSLLSLIVVKELFDDQYGEYSPLLLQLSAQTDVPCVALDYSELVMYTTHLSGEEDFFSAYQRVHYVGRERSEFPRLRFGLGDSRNRP